MTQEELDRAVARVTGESVRTVARLGFSLADSLVIQFDPEPSDKARHSNLRRDRRLPITPNIA